MKIIITLFCFIITLQNVFAQNSNYRLYQLLDKAKTPAKQVMAWSSLAEYYGYSGQTDSLLYASKQMLKIATNSNQNKLVEEAYSTLAWYFINICDYKQALDYRFKSLRLSEKANDTANILLFTKEIGVIFFKLKNYSEALRYLKRAESLLKEIPLNKQKVMINRVFTNMAEVFLGLSKSDSALRCVQLANLATEKGKDAYGYARVLYIFATVYKSKGDIDLAESYYKKCIAFSDAKKIYLPYVSASTDYGQYLFDNGKYDLSKEYAFNGFNIAKQAKNKLLIINTAALLRKVFYAVGQKDSSYFYADLKDVYTDSVFNDQQRNEIQNLSLSQQIKENEEQAKLAEESKKNKHNIQYALIAICIIILLMLYLLLSRSFITNVKLIESFGVVALLIVYEFLNLLLHPFLERITNHSPLLMLLALVFIAALLVPLHHKLEFWATAKLVEKNKQIRLAAAKITIQQLDTKLDGKLD